MPNPLTLDTDDAWREIRRRRLDRVREVPSVPVSTYLARSKEWLDRLIEARDLGNAEELVRVVNFAGAIREMAEQVEEVP